MQRCEGVLCGLPPLLRALNLMSFLIDHWAFLSLGFVIGMAHALEADHLAAVAAMSSRKTGRRALMARGAIWGLGHTLSLFLICSVVVVLGLGISGRVEARLEMIVGVMIALLGVRLLWKMRRERIHLHVHSHGDAQHLHLHSHADDTVVHEDSAHDHAHRREQVMTFGIGLLHGAAGSAGLLVLTVATTQTVGQAILYFVVFGIGSMAGMAALTTIASFPLAAIERSAGWMKTSTSFAIAGLAIWVGGSLMIESFAGL